MTTYVRVAAFAMALVGGSLSGCGTSLAAVGLERRATGDIELDIVGPYALAGNCEPPRGDVDPVTHAAIDERCITAASHRR